MLQWLPWQDAAEISAATGATWTLTSRSTARWARRVRPWAQELTLVVVLYGMWQYAGQWSLGRVGAAAQRGRTIWHLERLAHLPSERSMQALVLQHRSVVHWLNVFYEQAHVPALGLCLVWLFTRHRHHYTRVRTVVALVTGTCLAIQLFPVAPPRLLPHLGVVDTGALIGPSDYAGGAPGIDQLSAMPSVHVAWALVVAGGVVWASTRRWRWVALGYPVLTMFTVVVTGNHYWADGMVAVGLCGVAALIVAKTYGRPSPQSLAEQDVAQGGDLVVDADVRGEGSERPVLLPEGLQEDLHGVRLHRRDARQGRCEAREVSEEPVEELLHALAAERVVLDDVVLVDAEQAEHHG
jgi:hypothetical protein